MQRQRRKLSRVFLFFEYLQEFAVHFSHLLNIRIIFLDYIQQDLVSCLESPVRETGVDAGDCVLCVA